MHAHPAMTTAITLAFAFTTAMSANAQSTIYKCKSANGTVTYSQTGCTENQSHEASRTVRAEPVRPRPQLNNAPVSTHVPEYEYEYPQNDHTYQDYQQPTRQQPVATAIGIKDPGRQAEELRKQREHQLRLAELEASAERSRQRRERRERERSRIGQFTRARDPRTGQYVEGVMTAPNQIFDAKTGQYRTVIVH